MIACKYYSLFTFEVHQEPMTYAIYLVSPMYDKRVVVDYVTDSELSNWEKQPLSAYFNQLLQILDDKAQLYIEELATL